MNTGNRPKLLDLFCGAGGAALGYQEAGFHVTGVDHRPQPRYAGDIFVLDDALTYLLRHGHEYDVIHASPPCQGYSRMRHLPWLRDRSYPLLIDDTRARLEMTGRPWVIENVEDAPLRSGIVLCGVSFGLALYRHRRFESSHLLLAPPHRRHTVVIGSGRRLNDRAKPNADGFVSIVGKNDLPASRAAMGIDWMTANEIREAIPPAYAQWVGRQLMTTGA